MAFVRNAAIFKASCAKPEPLLPSQAAQGAALTGDQAQRRLGFMLFFRVFVFHRCYVGFFGEFPVT
jgi:hypothetical protein